jgi:hypothetical protein
MRSRWNSWRDSGGHLVAGASRAATARTEIKYPIPPGAKSSACRGCGAFVYWIRTLTGKTMPVDPDGTSHFATCSKAAEFKNKGGK